MRRKHNRLNETIKRFNPKVELDEFTLYLDENGYYKTQFRMLIQDFGEAMQGLGEQPFGMEVLIENKNIK